MTRLLTVAVLVSGEGTTLEGIAELQGGGHLPVRLALVVADRPHIPAIERARRRGLPTVVLPSRGAEPESWGRTLSDELTRHGVEVVVLAGFLSILPPSWIDRWRGRAINVHPSLLPRHGGPGMYGPRVHQAVLDAGETETGVTVHLVTAEVDRGPIIVQERVPVAPGDTPTSLRQRVHPIEVGLLAATLRRFADGSLPLPYPESGVVPSGHGPGQGERT